MNILEAIFNVKRTKKDRNRSHVGHKYRLHTFMYLYLSFMGMYSPLWECIVNLFRKHLCSGGGCSGGVGGVEVRFQLLSSPLL